MRQAVRAARRAPGLMSLIVLALAIGAGLNAGMFSVIDAFWFRGPVQVDPASFVQLIPQYSDWFPNANRYPFFTTKDYVAITNRSRSLTEVAAWSALHPRVDEDNENTIALLATCNFFSLHAIHRVAAGRLFTPNDCDQSDSSTVVVISYWMWQRRFYANPRIIGQSVRLNRQPFTVVGVLSPDESTWLKVDMWLPYTSQPVLEPDNNELGASAFPWLTIAGRMRRGFTRQQVQAELQTALNQQDRIYAHRRTELTVTDGSLIQFPGLRAIGLVVVPLVLGLVGLVLVIACANIIIVLLSRIAARRGEFAVRVALGARSRDLVAMLMAENSVTILASLPVSMYLIFAIPQVLSSRLLAQVGYGMMTPDWSSFAYLLLAMAVATAVIGLLPAGEALRLDVHAALRGREHTLTTKDRRGLLVAQLAVGFVLVTAAVTFARIQQKLASIDPGFETRQVLLVSTNSESAAPSAGTGHLFRRILAQSVADLPGISSYAYTTIIPFTTAPLEDVRLSRQDASQAKSVAIAKVSGGAYFATFGIRMARGTAFGAVGQSDRARASAVVSQAFAKEFWNSNQDPIGESILLSNGEILTVIGVAEDTKSEQYGVLDGPRVYTLQNPDALEGTLVVRCRGNLEDVARDISRLGNGLTDTLSVRTVQSLIEDRTERILRLSRIVQLVAMLALLLMTTGVYGAVAFSVNRRNREFGIRMALGATPRQIMYAVLIPGVRNIGYGLISGGLLAVPAGVVFSRLSAPSPFRVGAFDLVTYGTAAVIVAGVSVLAMFHPARIATRSDPSSAMRAE